MGTPASATLGRTQRLRAEVLASGGIKVIEIWSQVWAEDAGLEFIQIQGMSMPEVAQITLTEHRVQGKGAGDRCHGRNLS